jgi:hypothetical protein
MHIVFAMWWGSGLSFISKIENLVASVVEVLVEAAGREG